MKIFPKIKYTSKEQDKRNESLFVFMISRFSTKQTKVCFPRLRIYKEAKKISKPKVQNFKNYFSREHYWGWYYGQWGGWNLL